MLNFLPPSQTPPPRSATMIRHDRITTPNPIAFVYWVGLVLFCVTATILSLI